MLWYFDILNPYRTIFTYHSISISKKCLKKRKPSQSDFTTTKMCIHNVMSVTFKYFIRLIKFDKSQFKNLFRPIFLLFPWEPEYKKKQKMPFKRLGSVSFLNVFERSLLCSPRLHLFGEKKNSKTNISEKYYYNFCFDTFWNRNVTQHSFIYLFFILL